MNTHAKLLVVLLLLVLWTAFSWRWYTCGIKGFCGDQSPKMAEEMSHDEANEESNQ